MYASLKLHVLQNRFQFDVGVNGSLTNNMYSIVMMRYVPDLADDSSRLTETNDTHNPNRHHA